MPVTVRSVENSLISQSEFNMDAISRGSNGDGTFGKAIKYRIDEENPAKPYIPSSRAAGLIDITNSTSWALNPSTAKEDLVSYTLKLYQPKYSSVLTNLFTNISQGLQVADEALGDGFSFGEAVNGLNASNPYVNMMIADDLKWTIKVPLLSLIPQTYSTQFGNGENEGTNVLRDVANNITRYFTDNAASIGGIWPVIGSAFGANTGPLLNSLGRAIYPSINATDNASRFYRGSNTIAPFDLSFDLLNTISPEVTQQNIEFVRFMSYMVSARSRNRWIEDSPVIAEAEIGGLRFAPLVKLDFEYQGQGNFQYVGGEPIPEAYSCRINVSELLPHYRNLQHEYIHNGRKLRAINTDPKAFCNTLNQGIDLISGIVGRSLE